MSRVDETTTCSSGVDETPDVMKHVCQAKRVGVGTVFTLPHAPIRDVHAGRGVHKGPVPRVQHMGGVPMGDF